MAEQKNNFGCFISKKILDELSFDFYSNGKNILEERSKFYDKLIENVVSKKQLLQTNKKSFRDTAFIAGGFFIKYKRDKFKTEHEYQEHVSRQNVNIYAYFGKNNFCLVVWHYLIRISCCFI